MTIHDSASPTQWDITLAHVAEETLLFLSYDRATLKRDLARLVLSSLEKDFREHPTTSWYKADPYLGKGAKRIREKRFLGTLPTLIGDRFKPGKDGYWIENCSRMRAYLSAKYDILISHTDSKGTPGGWIMVETAAEMAGTIKHRGGAVDGAVEIANIEAEQIKEVTGVDVPLLRVHHLSQGGRTDNTTPDPGPGARRLPKPSNGMGAEAVL